MLSLLLSGTIRGPRALDSLISRHAYPVQKQTKDDRVISPVKKASQNLSTPVTAPSRRYEMTKRFDRPHHPRVGPTMSILRHSKVAPHKPHPLLPLSHSPSIKTSSLPSPLSFYQKHTSSSFSSPFLFF